MSAEQQQQYDRYEVVVLGAGYAGLMTALRLRPERLRVLVINGSNQFVERVRLQESIVAPVAPRIASIRTLLAGTGIDFMRGTVVFMDANSKIVSVDTDSGKREIGFEQAVYATGSNTNLDDIPGIAEHAYRLETKDGPRSPAALRAFLKAASGRAVKVIAVGGAETSVEVAGEIKTCWPDAAVTMISRSRCGEFKGDAVEAAVRRQLEDLGVTMIDRETITEVRLKEILTDHGRSLPYDICIWSGGLRGAPLARQAGIATDSAHRIIVDPNLRSISHPHILAVGDAAHPIAPTGAPYRLSAFAALASGAYAADLIAAQRNSREVLPFSFSTLGQGVAIGRGGVGFFSYPNDQQSFFIVRGPLARQIRNLFVWLVSYALKLERRHPGFFWWPGRARVSREQAETAMRDVAPPVKHRAA
jgi:NADH:ubiquinone reductase (H+-translocating)